jgi:hypothetical protein
LVQPLLYCDSSSDDQNDDKDKKDNNGGENKSILFYRGVGGGGEMVGYTKGSIFDTYLISLLAASNSVSSSFPNNVFLCFKV